MYENEIISELEKISGKSVDLSIEGMISSRVTFDKLKFEILHDYLNLRDNNNNYFVLNINQIVKLIIDKSIKIVTDSDIIISIRERKNAY